MKDTNWYKQKSQELRKATISLWPEEMKMAYALATMIMTGLDNQLFIGEPNMSGVNVKVEPFTTINK